MTARTIRADLEAQIVSDALRPGDRLPSIRSLAAQLAVSPATVAAAYRELRQRGMVVGRGRQGTVVAPTRRLEATTTAALPAGLVDAMNGSPDPDLLPALGPALAFATSLPQPRYGSALVAPRLAEAAARLFEADGIDASHLTVTSGAMDAVDRVLAALDLRIGDRIGVEDPGHFPVHHLARTSGLDLVPLPVDEAGITPAGLQAAIDAGIAALVVTPRAQNPTGATFGAERAELLSRLLAPVPSVAVIQDDHAGPIAGAGYFPITPPGPRWATMRSLGKSFGPDMRVALVAGDEDTIHRVATDLSNGPGWVSYILQNAAAYLLEDPATAVTLAATAQSYRQRRNHLIAALETYGVAATGSSGLNVWLPGVTEHTMIEAAGDAGYAIRGAAAYRLVSPPAVRVTISALSPTDLDTLAGALGQTNRRPAHAPVM